MVDIKYFDFAETFKISEQAYFLILQETYIWIIEFPPIPNVYINYCVVELDIVFNLQILK